MEKDYNHDSEPSTSLEMFMQTIGLRRQTDVQPEIVDRTPRDNSWYERGEECPF